MVSFIVKEKIFSRNWFRSYSYILVGTFLLALGYVYFITPHKIVPGGIYGISIILHYKIGSPVGFVALMFNIPITIIGIKLLGPKFGVKTVLGFSATAFFVDFLTYFSDGKALIPGDILLSCIFGGVLIGLGVAFLFKSRAASGGTDVVAMILEKYTRMPLGQLMMIVDSCIVLLSLVAFGDWKIPLYSWLTIFIMGKTIDMAMEGINYDKALFIISDKHEEIKDILLNVMNRGGTSFDGAGLYNGLQKNVIYTVMGRREVEVFKDHIRQIDPNAFVTVLDAKEILGKGFKSLSEK
jgi:uncharacterized membrane-anchored protein YitT (DUF2179 family)